MTCRETDRVFFFFQAEDGIRYLVRSRGLGDVYKRQDKHFYSHPGVNPFAVVRALFNNVFKMRRTSGASTITMQVAKALQPVSYTHLTLPTSDLV